MDHRHLSDDEAHSQDQPPPPKEFSDDDLHPSKRRLLIPKPDHRGMTEHKAEQNLTPRPAGAAESLNREETE
ncbi:hypothetical protein MJO29_012302 [Puccinia striiformis f. sp. tritici]|nr:hypothetical protein MJO29_012302 [Puccinia striiformis f. sp. tritici]